MMNEKEQVAAAQRTPEGDAILSVADLDGRPLDYWTLRAQGQTHETAIHGSAAGSYIDGRDHDRLDLPILIEGYKIGVAPTMPRQDKWAAIMRMIPETRIIVAGPAKKPEAIVAVGETPLQAVQRCLVASVFGARVSIPPEIEDDTEPKSG